MGNRGLYTKVKEGSDQENIRVLRRGLNVAGNKSSGSENSGSLNR